MSENNNKILCEILLELIAEGKFGNGKMIARDGWDSLITMFEDRTGLWYNNVQFGKRIAQLKRLYGFIKEITKSSGLGCGLNGWPDATNEWWDDVCKVICDSVRGANVEG